MTLVSKDITKAIEIVNNEDVVAIPTETVYGLAGNIYSEKAIRKIFQVKQRPLFNPLVVHVHSIEKIQEIVSEFADKAKMLAKAFWPGSLTLILKKRSDILDLITAGKDTVAVRIPNHPITLALLKELSFPLAAPSANPFGSISPTSSKHVESYFKNTIPMVLEGGDCKNGIESTIIGFENNEPLLYRLGAISIEEITTIIGEVKVKNKKELAPNAPGMLARHYAPETKTYLVKNAEKFIKDYTGKKIGVLRFSGEIDSSNMEHVEVLSKKGDLKEAASKLYGTLHKLDKLNLDMIVAEIFPDFGLGKSINDRLVRATKNK
ncbi:L-threonylcarbamoyladenylate synthase [Maribacter sp. ACAM166]|uniref:L-threonylcarbamoyladenylate synthase n=1 Tax=Maribacter sp. ACAM166 TaxID=2508996 RepID=UPI0010FD11AB|nr:L-threonylcarbamoyladenylate synthase [Maribacter sp. ACAM166]TLP75631.1 threonylcarbamoyl-AMP synthase [Maribacter sp. ACAM166]